MTRLSALCLLLTLLCACAVVKPVATNPLTSVTLPTVPSPISLTPTADLIPVTPTFAPSPTMTETPPPTATWTPEATPTLATSRFILSAENPMPLLPTDAHTGTKADVKTTIAALHRGQSLLPSYAEPVSIGNIVDSGGHKYFMIICNNGKLNCAPAALLKYNFIYNGQEYKDNVVLIMEIKTKITEENPDGRAYATELVNCPEWPWTGVYDQWRLNPTEFWNMQFTTAIAPQDQPFLRYRDSLTREDQQPGFQSAVDAAVTGDFSLVEDKGIVFP
jgi:hypothetical protein